MNFLTLLHNLRDAAHDDAGTQAWCTTNYGRNHKVYVGVDTRKPPGDDAYPLVHLYPVNKIAGEGGQTHIMGATCGIYDTALLAGHGKTDVVELQGIGNMEAFRKLVETALLAAELDAGHWVDQINTEFETIEFFPYFLTVMEIRITSELSFGDDYYQ